MKLVNDWKQFPRWLTVQAHALQVAVVGTWAMLPDSLRSYLPVKAVAIVVAVIAALGIAGRLIDQGKTDASHNP